jgi:hypothetical protein
LRIVYSTNGRNVTGFNVFGIRLRHKVCESWIKENKSIEYVMEHLRDANFDPEFYTHHEEEIISKFDKENSGNFITLKKEKLFLSN